MYIHMLVLISETFVYWIQGFGFRQRQEIVFFENARTALASNEPPFQLSIKVLYYLG